MNNLLIKNTELGIEKIFPKNYILNLIDKDSGKNLQLILNSFNMLFLSYAGNKAETRKLVPLSLRKLGLWITYVIGKTVVTEWYNSNAVDDTTWGSDTYWMLGSNMLVGDISISSQGTWVVNGEDTGISPKGDKGDSPLIRIYNNKILVSYNKGVTYLDLNNTPVYTKFRFNSLTNTYLVSYDLGTTWEDISDEKVYHKFRYNQSTNTYQESFDFGKTWSDISTEKVYTKFKFNRNTNTYQISTDLGLNWTDVSSDKVYYQFRYNRETNTHLVSTDFGNTWTNVSEDKVFYLFRTNDNRLLVSTDLGTTWENCSEPIAAWFKWADVSGTGNIGKIQISRDLLNWSDLSPIITNNLYIKDYVATISNLPSDAAIGDIYMVGPTYDESDITHDYPHYRMWVKLSSGWVDNGEFTNAGPVSTNNIIDEAVTINKLDSNLLSLLVYDVSARNGGVVFESLQSLLSSADLNTLIPTSVRHGGISIRFILSSDNKYVQYRLIADSWSVDTNDWAIAYEGVYVENPEFVYVKTDREGKILWAIKSDGTIYYGVGIPQQVQDAINKAVEDLQVDLTSHIEDLDRIINEHLDDIEIRIPQYSDTEEFVHVTLDDEGKLLAGITKEGEPIWGIGVPKVIKDFILPILDNIKGVLPSYLDNPEYIQLTLDANDNVIFGITKDGDISFGAGCPSQIRRYIENFITKSSTHEVTPEQFGAVGDGVTDDYEAFVAAINSGCNKIVLRNGGRYLISRKLIIDKPLTIEGVLLYGSTTYSSAIYPKQGIELAVVGITLRGFSISTGNLNDGVTALSLGNAYATNHRITLDHIQITHSGIGIYGSHGWCNIFNDVYVANCSTCIKMDTAFAQTFINLNLGGSGTNICMHLSGVNANFICANTGIREVGLLADSGCALTFYNSNFEWDNPQKNAPSSIKIVNSDCLFRYCTFGTGIYAPNCYAIGGENSSIEMVGCSLWHKDYEPEEYRTGHFWNPNEPISKQYSVHTIKLDNLSSGSNNEGNESNKIPDLTSIYPYNYLLSISDKKNGGIPIASLTSEQEQEYIEYGYLMAGFMYFNTSMKVMRTFNGISFI